MRGSGLIFRSVQRVDILAAMQQNYCTGVKDLEIQNTKKYSAILLLNWNLKEETHFFSN